MPAQLVLVRHGQTEYNLRGIYQGQADSPLTEEGRRQTRLLAPRLRALRTAAALYCSDLGRARQTAQLLADPGRHTLVADPGLRERAYGVFQGLPKAEIAERFPEVWARYRSGDPDYAIPDGESQRQFLERVVATIDRLAGRHPGERVVAVTHGGVCTAFAKHVLGLGVDAPRRFDVGNTSLSLFCQDERGRWLLRTLGELTHLGEPPEPNQTEG